MQRSVVQSTILIVARLCLLPRMPTLATRDQQVTEGKLLGSSPQLPSQFMFIIISGLQSF